MTTDPTPGRWMQTFCGRKFYFSFFDGEDGSGPDSRGLAQLDIRELAHACSNICRFGGHSRWLSVAEHCVRASWLVPLRYRLVTLIHDLGEGITGDRIHPLVDYARDSPIDSLAGRIQRACYYRWAPDFYSPIARDLVGDSKKIVKHADLEMLALEARDVLPGGPVERWADIELPPPPPRMRIRKGWKPKVARARFLDHFFAYSGASYENRYFDSEEL